MSPPTHRYFRRLAAYRAADAASQTRRAARDAAKTTTEAAAERLERARELVASGGYLATSGAVLVYSDAPGVPGYTVEQGRCPCPDAVAGYAFRHLSGRCKHVEAAALVGEARAIARGTVRALRVLSSVPNLTLLERINQAAAVAQVRS